MPDRTRVVSGAREDRGSIGEVTESESISLRVLGKFDLTHNRRSISVGISCQRLLTLLAINDGQMNRVKAAGLLWPDVTAGRANANLRSVLWRLQRVCRQVLKADFYDIRLAEHVDVDLHRVSATAFRLLDRSTPVSPEELKQALQCNLCEDLAPELGDEEWLTAERERFRQLRLHSLEALSEHLISAGWYGAAVETAIGAIQADPYRESAYLLLVRAHLAEGNQFEARRQYSIYRSLMRTELGLEPSEHFKRLIGDRDRRPGMPGPGPTRRSPAGDGRSRRTS
jgi:DNA-binding SARP family transcriptional activator